MARRPFYTHPQLDRPEYYLAVLEPGAQEALTGYLDAFRYAMPPHGGFAIGLERWTARLVGAANIRQVTTFPRDLKRLAP
jgi:nondiscriminating aspartyl-tRNA synthetase